MPLIKITTCHPTAGLFDLSDTSYQLGILWQAYPRWDTSIESSAIYIGTVDEMNPIPNPEMSLPTMIWATENEEAYLSKPRTITNDPAYITCRAPPITTTAFPIKIDCRRPNFMPTNMQTTELIVAAKL